jgi:hypothetical protein
MPRLFLLIALFSQSCWGKPSNCTNRFSVVRFDQWHNATLGLTPEELHWYQENLQKKYPSICYDATGHGNIAIVLAVDVSRHSGTQQVTTTQNMPLSGDVTIVDPSTGSTSPGTLGGTVSITTARDVPYETTDSFYMLRVDVWDPGGKWVPMFRSSRNQARQHGGNGWHALGTNVRERHPYQGLIEDALRFVDSQH